MTTFGLAVLAVFTALTIFLAGMWAGERDDQSLHFMRNRFLSRQLEQTQRRNAALANELRKYRSGSISHGHSVSPFRVLSGAVWRLAWFRNCDARDRQRHG